ncbi:MAG: hypothetical protein K0U30_06715 [Actinomycetia bacterium]|nr:hypothetical protein [Actinomycetes bacterium]
MNETPSNTGMGPDEPVGSKRSGQRNRNIVILGGLALVLVAGVILAGVIPTGDRAGTTATDPSASATPGATPSATATDDPTDDPTTDPSASPSSTATDDPTEEPVAVTTCAEGGACAVGDTGPGGGIVFYVASSPFTCAPDRGFRCTYLEAGTPIGKSYLCDPNTYSQLRPYDGIGLGSQNTYLAIDCPDGTLQAVKDMTAGGKSDWFVPSRDEMQLAYDNREVIGLSVGKNFAYWSSSLGNAGGTAETFRTDINYWNSNYYAGSSSFRAIPMRNF